MNQNNKNERPHYNDTTSLDQLRKRINACDEEGIRYLSERITLAKEIAQVKLADTLPVYHPDREREILLKIREKFPDSLHPKIESVMSTILRISREVQYEMVYPHRTDWLIRSLIDEAPHEIHVPKTVACQGIEGSYSHLAASVLFPDSQRIPVTSFEECIEKIKNKTCDSAFLPLENTTAGTVNDVYDLIVHSQVFINQSVSIPINHQLVLLPESRLDDIRRVISHPQALAQCSEYIRERGWERIFAENTAYAVRTVLDLDDPTLCAIASAKAGNLNCLTVLDEPICDSHHNRTRFVALSNHLTLDERSEKMSIFFTLPHQSGSLSSVLSIFADRGLNMTKIQSRPVPEKPWEYGFWVDLTAKTNDMNALVTLLQLSDELPFLQLLGWYEDRTID
jgi:chorismate mutase / prephenate dehydratase